LVTQSAAAAGSTGYAQFNNANALAADSNLFWDNTNKRLGIGTTAPAGALQIIGQANAWPEWVVGNSTTGQSYGTTIRAGTNSSDIALDVRSYGSTLLSG
jgi:hypothetical protein